MTQTTETETIEAADIQTETLPEPAKQINIASFTISNPKAFLTELNLIRLIVKGKNTIPVLDCISFEIQPDKIIVVGTDLDNTLTCEIGAQTSGSLKTCVELESLIKAVKTAKNAINGTITETVTERMTKKIDSNGEPEKVKYSEIQLQLKADNSIFRLECQDQEKFPIFEVDRTKERFFNSFGAGTIQELIKKTIFSTTNEQSRFTLDAIALEFGAAGLRMIATDGHRMALADTKDFKVSKKKVSNGFSDVRENFLLNTDGARVLTKIADGKVFISKDENHLHFRTMFGARQLQARIRAGNFPNYEMIYPTDTPFELQFHPKEIAELVKSALGYADERTKAIGFQPYNNNFIVKAGGGEKAFTGAASCNFPRIDAPGIGCNAQYFIDLVSVVENQVLTMKFKDGAQQLDITGENEGVNFRFFLMPFRPENGGNYTIISDQNAGDYPLRPFYKEFEAKPAIVKTDKKQIKADVAELLNDLQTIAAIDGMPELFTEIVNQTVLQAIEKLKLL